MSSPRGTDPEEVATDPSAEACSEVMPRGRVLELRVCGPDCTVQRFTLAGPSLVVGRAPSADLRLDHETIYPHHAMIRVTLSDVFIADLGSRTGTWADGNLVDLERVLRLGELVEIGPYTLWIGRTGPKLAAQARATDSDPRMIFGVADFLARAADLVNVRAAGLVTIQVLALRSAAAGVSALASELAREAGASKLVAVTGDSEITVLATDLGQADTERLGIRLLRIAEFAAPEASLGFVCSPMQAADLQAAFDVARALVLPAVTGEVVGQGPDGVSGSLLAADGRRLVLCDSAAQAAYRLLFHLAKSGRPVLLAGETGTGKEEAARKLHQWSARPGPLVAVSCAEIHEPLLSAELFGSTEGAFANAKVSRLGLVQRAQGGTLFLDNIGELSDRAQGALLRFVETREARPVGGGAPQRLDVGVVAATVPVELLRQELRHRFTVVNLPPLRYRPDDIWPMGRTFLHDACNRRGRRPLSVSPDAVARLRAYSWPGNVRELVVLMETMASKVESDGLQTEHLRVLADSALVGERVDSASAEHVTSPSSSRLRSQRTLREIERDETRRALEETNGNLTRAAAILGITRNTLKRRLAAYGFGRPSSQHKKRTW